MLIWVQETRAREFHLCFKKRSRPSTYLSLVDSRGLDLTLN